MEIVKFTRLNNFASQNCREAAFNRASQKALSRALSALKSGEVIVCPTDTIYGFLADATNKKAIEKIFKIKKRPRQKPLPVFVKDIRMAKQIAEISQEQEKIIKKHWPGKYTFVLRIKNRIDARRLSSWIDVGRLNTIALRIPKYKFLNDLLKKINKPLAQTSVNISGQPPLTKISDIIKLMESCGTSDVPQLIIDGGDLPKNKPSVIIDLSKDKIKTLRA